MTVSAGDPKRTGSILNLTLRCKSYDKTKPTSVSYKWLFRLGDLFFLDLEARLDLAEVVEERGRGDVIVVSGFRVAGFGSGALEPIHDDTHIQDRSM